MRKNLFLLVLLAGAFAQAAPAAQAAQSADPARRGYVSSATRDARLASYYNGYARRIECVGNRAYPPVAKGQTLQVVATASVRADGVLENAVLERASGVAELDAAALAMIRAGAPYAAFPPALKSRYAALDLVATWTFGPVNVREAGPPTDC